ncbi:hypothetical protein TWF281_001125 [Arthrobotrys megalospora]
MEIRMMDWDGLIDGRETGSVVWLVLVGRGEDQAREKVLSGWLVIEEEGDLKAACCFDPANRRTTAEYPRNPSTEEKKKENQLLGTVYKH